MKRKIVIAAVAAAVLVGGGAAGAVAFADDDGHDREVRSSVASDGTARVSVQDAVAAALKAVPGTVTGAELDDEDGGLVWELDVYGSDKVWHDVTVDAGNGKVLGKHTDDEDDDRDRHAPRSAAVSLDSATGAALKAAPGTVTSVDLDDDRDDRGAAHWEVEVRGEDGKEHELDVDARTGKVTADRSDDDGHAGGDGKHDDRHDDDRDGDDG
ncbi:MULTISPECIES: PepSY domain-containing protein [unclassified Streptomyces]|uniref:PepSY domain-containing protein n=1 Tax=unclassified Streptomyces TaxID=2593676 RepID=UPI003322B536